MKIYSKFAQKSQPLSDRFKNHINLYDSLEECAEKYAIDVSLLRKIINEDYNNISLFEYFDILEKMGQKDTIREFFPRNLLGHATTINLRKFGKYKEADEFEGKYLANGG